MKKLSLLAFMVLGITLLNAQNWQWDYGKFVNRIPHGITLTEPLHIDLMHNTFIATRFDSVLIYSDTSFHQTASQWGHKRLSISKHDLYGNFIKALEFVGKDRTIIHKPMIATDSQSNIYLTLAFRDTLIINGTAIIATSETASQFTSLLVAKFDPYFKLLWHGLIESRYQEMNNGLLVSYEDEVYLAAFHASGVGGQPYQVSFLGQDTSTVINKQLTSLLKLNTEGEIIWRKEILHNNLAEPNFDLQRLFTGEGEEIKLFYSIRSELFIDNDTIDFPEISIYPRQGYVLLTFEKDGSLISSEWLARGFWMDVVFDSDNNIYFSGVVHGNLIIFPEDTIHSPIGINYSVLGKLNHQRRLQWYHIFKATDHHIQHIGLHQDKFLFAVASQNKLEFFDTLLQWPGATINTVVVELDSDGHLSELLSTHSAWMCSGQSIYDNCGNIVLAGSHQRYSVFGQDTLNTTHWGYPESFIAKINRVQLPEIHLGPDTLACESYTIMAAEGYTHYIWNGNATNLPHHEVNETGSYELRVAGDDYCWLVSKVEVEIHPGFTFILGNDTTITTADTLILHVAGGYDAYLWFDGSQDSTLTLIGNDYGETLLDVWVEVTSGPCVVRNSMLLTIESGSGLEEPNAGLPIIFPNPASDKLYISNPYGSKIKSITIYNQFGQKVIHSDGASGTIDVSMLGAGIYILEIDSKGQKIRRKLIIRR